MPPLEKPWGNFDFLSDRNGQLARLGALSERIRAERAGPIREGRRGRRSQG